MAQVSTIGPDLAKNVFQVHAIDAQGKVLVRRKLSPGRGSALLCQTASLHGRYGSVWNSSSLGSRNWGRELIKLGHTVRLMPPAYVKPYVKRGKTDAADAEAIAEAVSRPTMRFVAVKTVDQQAVLMLHKAPGLRIQVNERGRRGFW